MVRKTLIQIVDSKTTEAMIISFPAAAEPPIIETTRLGKIARVLVKKFLIHGFILRSRNPYKRTTKSIDFVSENIFS